jgi:hypothetical protein
MLSSPDAGWRMVKLGSLARLASLIHGRHGYRVCWGAVRALSALLAPLAGVEASPDSLAVEVSLGRLPEALRELPHAAWAFGLIESIEPPLGGGEGAAAAGEELEAVTVQAAQAMADALTATLPSHVKPGGRLDSSVRELAAALRSATPWRAVEASRALRDTVLASTDTIAELAAELGVGEAGLPLLLAKLSSIVGWRDGMLLLDPSTEREVFAAIEAAVERMYLHQRASTTWRAGGSHTASGVPPSTGEELVSELEKALAEGNVSKAARLLAEIYSTGNPRLIAEAARLLRSVPPSLSEAVSRLASLARLERQLPSAGLPTGMRPPALPAWVGAVAAAALASVAAIAVAAVLPRLSKLRLRLGGRAGRAPAGEREPRELAVKLFIELVEELSRRFSPRLPWETAREYARKLPEGLRGDYMSAVRVYEEARFSRHRVGLERVRVLEELLRRVRGWRR